MSYAYDPNAVPAQAPVAAPAPVDPYAAYQAAAAAQAAGAAYVQPAPVYAAQPAPAFNAYYAPAPGNPDDVRTIFVTGFPDDVKERELNNLLRFLPGYEVRWGAVARASSGSCLPSPSDPT